MQLIENLFIYIQWVAKFIYHHKLLSYKYTLKLTRTLDNNNYLAAHLPARFNNTYLARRVLAGADAL